MFVWTALPCGQRSGGFKPPGMVGFYELLSCLPVLPPSIRSVAAPAPAGTGIYQKNGLSSPNTLILPLICFDLSAILPLEFMTPV